MKIYKLGAAAVLLFAGISQLFAGGETESPEAIPLPKWEKLESSGVEGLQTYRTKVPGGWLVMAGCIGIGLVFFPDAKHEWDGKSIDWEYAIDPIEESPEEEPAED